MNTVEPIRDMNLIWDIEDYLQARSERDYVMFLFGIYTGLRISDILKLRVRDVRGKDFIYMREKKTSKEKRFPIHDDLKPILDEYIKDMKDFEYLFKSRKGINKPISREYAYRILKDAANAFGLECIGCHTMRKTFGYFVYKETKDIVTIQKIFNHSSPGITLRYIGIDQDRKDSVMKHVHFIRNRKRNSNLSSMSHKKHL